MSGSGRVAEQRSYLEMECPSVRQTVESSTNDGKSWTKTFDGLYVRRK